MEVKISAELIEIERLQRQLRLLTEFQSEPSVWVLGRATGTTYTFWPDTMLHLIETAC